MIKGVLACLVLTCLASAAGTGEDAKATPAVPGNKKTDEAVVSSRAEGNSVSPNPQNQSGLDKAFLKAVTNNDLDGVRFLMGVGANSSTVTETGSTGLHVACERGYIRIARELIKTNPALVRIINHELVTPLHAAALHGQVTLVQHLLDNGAEINAQDIYGSTPLHCAAFNDDTLLGRFLMSRGSDPNLLDKYNSTAIHVAAYVGNKMMVTVLAMEGVPIDAQDKGGSTALHAASFYGHGQTVRELLLLGADSNLADKEGRRSKDVWCACKQHKILVCEETCLSSDEDKKERPQATT